MLKKAIWMGMGAGLAYLGYRVYLDYAQAKGGKLATDLWGNYDLDGVSYDHENNEVVVSGDHTHGAMPSAPQIH